MGEGARRVLSGVNRESFVLLCCIEVEAMLSASTPEGSWL